MPAAGNNSSEEKAVSKYDSNVLHYFFAGCPDSITANVQVLLQVGYSMTVSQALQLCLVY
jgi:hypothetical protein